MSPTGRAFTVDPSWLQSEANRLAQTATPEQQQQTVKLMTPLMSDIEQGTSPSPPSKGLTGPLEPLFGMAYLNESEHGDRQTPRKSQAGRKSAFSTPTRRPKPGQAGSPVPSSRRSTPLATSVEYRKSPKAAWFSPKPTAHTSSSTNANDFVEQVSSRMHQTTPCPSASHAKSPRTLAPTSNTAGTPTARWKQCSSSRVSESVQTPGRKEPRESNATRWAEGKIDGSEVGDDLNEEDEEVEEINGLNEAKTVFSDCMLPDFVIRKPTDGLARQVVFRPRNKHDESLLSGELTFEFWNEEQTHGFWTLTDDKGFRWIVKYFASGQKYRPWLSVQSGYHEEGLAFPRKRKQFPEAQKLASQNTMVGDVEESGDEASESARTFRKRNIDQVHPYFTEKTNYKRSQVGKAKKDFKTEYVSDSELSPSRPSTNSAFRRSKNPSRTPSASRRTSAQNDGTLKLRVSTNSAKRKITPPPTPPPLSLEKIQNNTTLYIFTNSDFTSAPGTIYLKSCKDIDSFFSVMPLVAGVEEQDIRQITVRFDWLAESKPRTIRMIKGLEDSYEKMMEEIRGAPGWREGGDGRASVFVDVVLK